MPLRPATLADAPALAEIYRDSARVLGAAAYSRAQLDAWTSWPDDFAEFSARVTRGVALVSLAGDAIASFAQLEPDDCIALLYTAPRFARRGHATAFYLALEDTARQRGVTRLHTIASHLSRPLFEKHGFRLYEIEQTVFKGVAFERFKMEKSLPRST